MKANGLSSAIVIGLGLFAGASSGARALNLNPLQTGQALVYPYYTVNGGNQSLISIVNKSDAGKAITVRFREGRNSRIALEFNLYLSPFDVWTASAFSISDSGPNNPANLVTTDNSCTVPRIKNSSVFPTLPNGNRYLPFSNQSYSGSNNDAGPNTLDRNREGYFEMIEMGEIEDTTRNSLRAITHGATGIPANCLQVERAWLPAGSASETTAYWTTNALVDLTPPKGGLFGAVAIVDALAGTMMSYNAEAIDAFSDIVQHTQPGSGQPTLASARSSADSAIAYVFDNGALIASTYPLSRAIDAVSALFMQDEIFNEFVTSASMGAASEWVVTFPTKYAYTDQAIVGDTATAPFTRIFPRADSSTNIGAAVDIEENARNREAADATTIEFSPPPPPPQWLWASNVIGFNPRNADASPILGSQLVDHVIFTDTGAEHGWAAMRLYSNTTGSGTGSLIARQRLRPDQNGGVWNGLPITGFLATSYTNGQLIPGVLSNYAGIYPHQGENRYVRAP